MQQTKVVNLTLLFWGLLIGFLIGTSVGWLWLIDLAMKGG